ncbi:MAG: hypothetical protein EBV15_05620 [Bacteroidetes bacterium]|jgi:hypothetical protein|nr:hypothetical protein [Bacteroidota bacterium]
MVVELHILGMPKPFPRLYVIDRPQIGEQLQWQYPNSKLEKLHFTATIADILPLFDEFYIILLYRVEVIVEILAHNT